MLLRILISLLLYYLSGCCIAQNVVKAIRLWPSPSNVRVVFDTQDPVSYQVYCLQAPSRIVIDFQNTTLAAKIADIGLQNTGITKIRSGIHDNKLRIVFEVDSKVKPNSFSLQPNERYGNRLVVDLEKNDKQQILALFELDDLPKSKNPQHPRLELPDFIVAIDPGHGGEDPGAIGPRGTMEKTVVLEIAKHLNQLINQQSGMKSFLIRNADYYVGLRERMSYARNNQADLFISIHADAFHRKHAQGASVFVLSETGATSEAARWLAESENSSDSIGGVVLEKKNDMLASVLLDLSQRANEAASLEAANYILGNLGKSLALHKNHVERAGFAVLKAPDVPSILVETGFISHPDTEKKLRQHSYQLKLAQHLLNGVQEYFKGKPKRCVKYGTD